MVPQIAASKAIHPVTKIELTKQYFDIALEYFASMDLRLEGANCLKNFIPHIPLYTGGRVMITCRIVEFLNGGQYFRRALDIILQAENDIRYGGNNSVTVGMTYSGDKLGSKDFLFVNIWILKCQCLKGMKEFKKALILQKKVFEVNPEGFEKILLVPYLYVLMKMGKYSKVKQRLEKTNKEQFSQDRQVALSLFCWICSSKIGEHCTCLPKIIEWLCSLDLDVSWVWYLCSKLFDGLEEHFELALPLFTFVMERKSLDVSDDGELVPKFNITKNALFIGRFFKDKIIMAKNM